MSLISLCKKWLYPSLKVRLFTSSAIDNLDVDPSSNTATTSFHGTALSLFQHRGSEKYGNDKQSSISLTNTGKKLRTLPCEYMDINLQY